MSASGGIPYGIQAGAAEAGMGYACVMKEGFWSSFHNQALFAFNDACAFGFNYDNRFGIKELGTRTAGVLLPAGKTSLGAAYSNFGYSDFKRNFAGIGCGMRLSGKIAAGVQADYFSESTSGEYNRNQYITFEAGIIVSPSERIKIGLHIFNPLPNSMRKICQPSSLSAGAGIELSNTLFGGVEAELCSGKNLNLKSGFEYRAVKNLLLRAGFSSQHNSFSFGTGYQAGIVTMDIGFASHDQLGVSSSVSLIFKIR